MRRGVRLTHPSLRGCTYTLIHHGRPLVRPVACHVCGLTHYHKTYHLALDSLGRVTVSETVYERLKEAGLDELRAVTEDTDPQPQRVAIGEPMSINPVVSREQGILVR